MTEDELISSLKTLTKNKDFKKKYRLKSIKVVEMFDGVNLIFNTKNFRWSACVEYKVDDKGMINTWSDVNYEIERSSFEILEDYLCRDDINYTRDESAIINYKGKTPDEITINMVEDIIEEFDEPSMIKRYKAMTEIIKRLERLNSDDVCVIGMIADVI